MEKPLYHDSNFSFHKLLDGVVDFDVEASHAGILLKDNSVLNFDVNADSRNFDSLEDLLAHKQHSLTRPDVGKIRSIASGNNFNLLVTESEEVFGQPIRPNEEMSLVMAQPLKYDQTQPVYKIEMISDYNLVHSTKVLGD